LICIADGIGGEEPTGYGIIVTRLHVGEARLVVLDMACVPYIILVRGRCAKLLTKGGLALAPC